MRTTPPRKPDYNDIEFVTREKGTTDVGFQPIPPTPGMVSYPSTTLESSSLHARAGADNGLGDIAPWCTCAINTAAGDQVPYDLQYVSSQGTCHPGALSDPDNNLAPDKHRRGKTCSSV